MIPKKLCSIGILDIELNLILYKSQAEKNKFDIDNYNKVQDLKNLFYSNDNNGNNIDYFKYIFLSSENTLINTLLFINRAYKTKTFIEFIMPNHLDFSESTKFVKNLLTDVCNRNYLFIIENRILDVASKIKFNIKIIDDETKDIIQSKYFELFEMNDLEIDLNINKDNNDSESNEEKYNSKNKPKFNIKMEYTFDNTDYFLIDLFLFKELIGKNKINMINFIYNIINKNKNILIILIMNNKCFKGIEFTSLLDIYKEIIELSDIIFCNKNELNYFFKTYNELKKKNIFDGNYKNFSIISKKNNNAIDNNNSILPKIYKNKNIPHTLLNINEIDLDLIIIDNDKHRKNIPRISILLDNFESATIYSQSGANMDIDYSEIFYFKMKQTKLNINNDNNDKNEKYFYYFIGGFLSRYIYTKSFRVCFFAGFLLLKKILKNIIKKKYLFNIDEYNVLVPNEKKTLKEKIIQQNLKLFKEKASKENGFILDCTNINGCKIKNYNPLLDDNCASYLLNKNNFEHLKKHGFINKNGIILKDPGKYEKAKYHTINKKKNLKPIYIELNNTNKRNNNFNKKLYNTLKISCGNSKDYKNNKYSKTINSFYKIKNRKNLFINYQKNNKENNIFKNNLISKSNRKEEYSTLFSRTTKNFDLNFKKIINSPIKDTKKKNIIMEKFGINNTKSLGKNKQTKLPKYEKYKKYLFQLYRPDIKFSEFLEREESKKGKIKRNYSQI